VSARPDTRPHTVRIDRLVLRGALPTGPRAEALRALVARQVARELAARGAPDAEHLAHVIARAVADAARRTTGG
jgi:hypothetical protein